MRIFLRWPGVPAKRAGAKEFSQLTQMAKFTIGKFM